MKFNYMLPRAEQMRACVNGEQHHYLPTGHMEATIGHVAVRFRCKRCDELATAFLEEEKYRINENLLKKYGE
jgi:hypothetical protein